MPTVNKRPYHSVATKLTRQINRGMYTVGDRLPAERQLAEAFKVTRPTVREAIVALEVKGLVEVRPGSGVYVTAQTADVTTKTEAEVSEQASGQDETVNLVAWLEARQLIEASVVALAASKLSKAQVKKLQKLGKALENADEAVTLAKADLEFHRAIARASQNSVLAKVLNELLSYPPEPDLAHMIEVGGGFKKLKKVILKDHTAIVKALESGKAGKASKAMTKHLDRMLKIASSADKTVEA